MTDLPKPADALEEIANSESNLRQGERDSCREAAALLRSAAAVDVAGLMAMILKFGELSKAHGTAIGLYGGDFIEMGRAADSEKAALESALRLALAAREGFVMVPSGPTREMLNAAIDVDSFKLGDISPLGFRCSPQQLFERCYRAMLAAAPKETP